MTIVNVKNITELQAALDSAVDGTIINFAADITGDAIINQPGDQEIDLIINGNNYSYDGQRKIKGNSSNGAETLVIKNINFATSTAEQEFIWCNDSANGSPWRYAHNITIDNCTFTASGEAVHSAIGAKFQQVYNIKVLNCTATNMRTLLQAESCGTDVTVEGCKIVNGKNGVSFNNTTNAVIKNTDIEAVGDGSYGIRHKGEVENYALTVENCNVKAFVPVLLRNMTGKGYVAAFSGTNTLSATNAFGYQIVISAGDWDNDSAAPSAPTGTYTITGADAFAANAPYAKN